MHATSNDLVLCRALDEGGYTPQIGDGRPWTTSSCREQVADTMRHAHRPHDIVRSLEIAHLDNPEPAVHMHEGQTPGFNANMQAHRAPCPGPGTTTDEQNVHLASAAQLKGEEKRMPAMSSKQAAVPGTRSTSNALISPTLSSKATPSSPEPAPEPDISPSLAESAANAQQEHAPSPSCIDTAAVDTWFDTDPHPGGDGLAHLGTDAICLAPSLQCPGAFAEDPGESGGVLTVENGAPPPCADPDGAAPTFTTETADAGAPAPCMPAEAKCSHDRPPWEKPIGNPVTCKVRTIAQGPHQTGSTDTDDPNQSDHRGHAVHPLQLAHIDATFLRHQLAIFKPFPISVDHQVPPHTDPAPASTAECTTTCNVPHREAVKTSNWAALAMCPATTFADANGTIAVYWHAKSWHAFPIDGGTMPPFLRQKENTPSPTIRSAYNTTTHGSQEASHLRSPISGASVNLKAPAPPFSDSHAAIAFMRDHQYHSPDPLGHQDVKPPDSHATDDTVPDTPTPLLPAKVKHFAASPGPHTK